ncbi:polyprenyl diphosphate synthase [Marinithermus hydrothermalis]|uniref:Isoprenyl transferase n=1 Tax=Marinithermus hydrothermalis (strain DSM 14884 / JCM 11576 / T1) TaxID=869210 RepID=F2NQJ7_MARHT|nr:polyprenyl diphosphate synthase [Marinithermus hydrothermalis]AEB11935.1 Undecaprenyl pyrophosphate synthase [Marinithermus hydrothermalis DSM 14884]
MSVPRHVAIIMDGNGRWAQARGLPRFRGHLAGREAIRAAVRAAVKHQVEWLTLYAFSTENWRRPQEEVDALFELFETVLWEETPNLVREGVRIHIIGEREGLPPTLLEAIRYAEEASREGTRLHLVGALNYGGRQEILSAVRRMVAEGLEPTEENLRRALYLPEMPDPDLIIRTSGELRLSNFLLWQSAYSEIWVTDTLWPDFSEEHFGQAVQAYQERERRFGGVPQR